MIIFDLICADGGHQFEGWFGSSVEFDQQKASGLLACPVCGASDISKAMMAPNVAAKSNQKSGSKVRTVGSSSDENGDLASAGETASQSTAIQVPAEYKELVGKMAKAQKAMLDQSEWVGKSFPEKAREMHYGDSEKKAIHGTATPDEVSDLDQEGVELTALPFPVVPPEDQN